MDDLGQTSTRQRRRKLLPAWDRLDDRCLLSGLSPAELTSAYGLNAITFHRRAASTVKGDGAGETIALIEAYHDPTIASDLKTFDQAYGLPNPTLTVDNLAGWQIDPGWGLEESLDVEWAHAIAPAANILVVEASSPTLQGLVAAVNVAQEHARCRGDLDELGIQRIPSGGILQHDVHHSRRTRRHHVPRRQRRQRPTGRSRVAIGRTDGDGRRRHDPVSRRVGSNIKSETAWVGSSGGYSRFEAEPEYQRSVQGTGRRSTPGRLVRRRPRYRRQRLPDVAPATGTGRGMSSAGRASVHRRGRPSSPSPTRAGRSQGKGSLDGATQTLPTLYALSSSDFQHVTPVRGGAGSPATATANTATGRGTPIGHNVISGLVASELAVPLTTNASAGTRLVAARRTASLAQPPVARNAGTRHWSSSGQVDHRFDRADAMRSEWSRQSCGTAAGAFGPSWINSTIAACCRLLPVCSSGYTPAQITTAYGLNAITFTSSSGSTVKGDGAGETIALIEINSDPQPPVGLEYVRRQIWSARSDPHGGQSGRKSDGQRVVD